MSLEDITLIIPTHERHSYLDRVLDYYSRYDLSMYIVDSSTLPYSGNGLTANMKYLHFPGISYTSKMESVFNKSKTFEEAEEWDILQQVEMTPEERQKAAAELRLRFYGDDAPDVKEAEKRK